MLLLAVAEDALSRNRGDANLAAEWLLTLPSYVDANKTNYEGYGTCTSFKYDWPASTLMLMLPIEHSKRNDQAKSERAELDATVMPC